MSTYFIGKPPEKPVQKPLTTPFRTGKVDGREQQFLSCDKLGRGERCERRVDLICRRGTVGAINVDTRNFPLGESPARDPGRELLAGHQVRQSVLGSARAAPVSPTTRRHSGLGRTGAWAIVARPRLWGWSAVERLVGKEFRSGGGSLGPGRGGDQRSRLRQAPADTGAASG